MARPGLTKLPPPAAIRTLVPQALTLTEQYREVREASLALCAPLAVEDYVVQSMPDASPAKWHLAHTTWFFEEFVLQHSGGAYDFHDTEFRYLFNSYYNAVGPMHTRSNRGLLSRPTVQQVLDYRARIDERMQALLCNTDGIAAAVAPIITLGLHHEQQHQELLLTDIKHLFSCNPLLPAYVQQQTAPSRAAPGLSYRYFPGGLVDIGYDERRVQDTDGVFCFDNELPRHRTYIAPFELATRLITNAEYLEFILDEGYQNAAQWLSDGWATVQREQLSSLGEAGLVNLFQTRPILHPMTGNMPRLIEFIRAFLKFSAGEQAPPAAPDTKGDPNGVQG